MFKTSNFGKESNRPFCFGDRHFASHFLLILLLPAKFLLFRLFLFQF